MDSNTVNHVCKTGGTKVLEAEARKYIIGAYIETNGQGTIIVNWEELNKALVGKEELKGAKKLVALLKIANPFCSDAIANLLMVEAVLRDKDYPIANFSNIYIEHPCLKSKAPVANPQGF